MLESKAQARMVSNAARYLTDAGRGGSISSLSNDNRRTYNNTSNVNLSGVPSWCGMSRISVRWSWRSPRSHQAAATGKGAQDGLMLKRRNGILLIGISNETWPDKQLLEALREEVSLCQT